MPTSATAGSAAAEQRRAVLAGLACYVAWGLVPLVLQAIAAQGPGTWEIMCHRILWGLVASGVFVLVARQWREVVAVLRTPKTVAWLALSGAFIATNWTVYIWSVNHGHTIEASLGYYITPLINMAAGALLFRERIGRIGQAAIALAAAGVIIQAVAIGHLPYVALVLGFSFGCYGIVRKRVAADALAGLFVECLILAAPALAYVLWLQHSGAGHFTSGPAAAAWLIASGPITAAPLALFAWAARRMPLSTLGFLQFLAPTIAFFIGVGEGEAFTPLRALSFVFIWVGAMVFVYGLWRKARTARAALACAA
jgi:chloramphenicol-sensitive protein RarD